MSEPSSPWPQPPDRSSQPQGGSSQPQGGPLQPQGGAQLPPNGTDAAADERAIDAWLGELFVQENATARRRRKLDDDRVAAEILAKLPGQWRADQRKRLGDSRGWGDRARMQRILMGGLAGGLGLAAAVLLTVTLRRPAANDSLAQSGGDRAAVAQAEPLVADAGSPSHRQPGIEQAAIEQGGIERGGIEQGGTAQPGESLLTLDSQSPQLPEATPHDPPTIPPENTAPSPPVLLAGGVPTLDQFNQQFQQYWQALGVEPAPELSKSMWQQRLQERLGLSDEIAPLLASDQEAAAMQLISSPAVSEQLAQRLVDQLSEGLQLTDERRQRLVADAAQRLRSGQRFDQWLSGWVWDEWQAGREPDVVAQAADDPQQWAAAMGHRGQWLAEQMLGADIACARCHDSPIDSRFAQDQYWALAAMFAGEGQPLFYELADGRQRVADAGVPERWLSGQRGSLAQVTEADELARRLVGSRQVARSLVNQLWAVGFGEPLVGSASSPISPPIDDSLEAALDLLADRLIAAEFDLRVAVVWMAQSAPMKRGVAHELTGTAWQFAGEAELAKASLAQRSFAAARLPWPAANQPQLLAMMRSRQGVSATRLDRQDRILAQPASTALPLTQGTPGEGVAMPQLSVNNEDFWWTQWLADRQAIRGGWLESIRGRDQKLRHAFYAAGHHEIDPERWQAINALVPGGQNAELPADAASQIFWIIQQTR